MHETTQLDQLSQPHSKSRQVQINTLIVKLKNYKMQNCHKSSRSLSLYICERCDYPKLGAFIPAWQRCLLLHMCRIFPQPSGKIIVINLNLEFNNWLWISGQLHHMTLKMFVVSVGGLRRAYYCKQQLLLTNLWNINIFEKLWTVSSTLIIQVGCVNEKKIVLS